MKDIYAYHHTNKEAAISILKNGFNSSFFRKISQGYGVQCFLDKHDSPVFKDKEEGQIEVLFKNCRLLDVKSVNESLERIQRAEPYENQLEIAKIEAERIKNLGYDAYLIRVIDKKMGVIFLQFPKPIRWIPFENYRL